MENINIIIINDFMNFVENTKKQDFKRFIETDIEEAKRKHLVCKTFTIWDFFNKEKMSKYWDFETSDIFCVMSDYFLSGDFDDNYFIFDQSEKIYDYEIFDDQKFERYFTFLQNYQKIKKDLLLELIEYKKINKK